jgi:hypothetical protein
MPAGTIIGRKRISPAVSAIWVFGDRMARPGLFTNPNSLSVVGSTETVYQGPGALEAAMGGAKLRPER